jgi:hypothetical protein
VARVLSIYRRTLRTYAAWAGTLLPLAVVVFVPLGLVHAIPVHADLTDLELGGSIELVVTAAALLLLAMTGLIGEVFYAGAVSIALTHPHQGMPPSLREVASMVNYRTLIAVDIAFGLLVAVGLVALVVPGIVVFVYLGLAAPAAEIEGRGFNAAFSRSLSLVREHFWLVFWVLVPIEIASSFVTAAVTSLSDELFSAWLLSEWMTDTLSNIVLTPFYAVAAVLLTIDLIADRDGAAPHLRSTPVTG